MQAYLKPSELKIRHHEAQEIFKLRSQVTDVKENFKGKYENLICEICKKENESQLHIIQCEELNILNES